jgi:pyroglutamyl-peptidase
MQTLITGFDNFESRTVNQSWLLAEKLRETHPGLGADLLQLPVTFYDCMRPIHNWLETSKQKPRLIVSLGEAAIEKIRFECVGLNKRHCTRPDNSGRTFFNTTIAPHLPLSLETKWDVQNLAKGMNLSGFELPLSYSAGSYVCNNVLFELLRLEKKNQDSSLRVCFLHVPIRQTDADRERNANWLVQFINILKGSYHAHSWT